MTQDDSDDEDDLSLEQMRDDEFATNDEAEVLAPAKHHPWRPRRWRKAVYVSEHSATCDAPAWQRDRSLLPRKPPTKSGRPWEPER